MPKTLVYDTQAVFAFVRARVPIFASEGMQAIGLAQDGNLIAGVVFEGFNGHNMWMHVAAQPGAKWLTRAYLQACFAYPFIQCGVSRVSGYVEASNTAAKKFDEHLGFTQEAVLKGAASDGGDAIIYVMHKGSCRYV